MNNKIFIKLPKTPNIKYIDGGAAGSISKRWKPFQSFLTYYGFEPNRKSYQKIKSKLKTKQFKIFNFALGGKKINSNLYITKNTDCCSLLKPNKKIYEKFKLLKERMQLTSYEPIKCINLDNVSINNPDFLKLDLQGYELKALRGSKFYLKELLGAEIEITFHELYKNSPNFGQIIDFLSLHNFTFIDLSGLSRLERDSEKISEHGQLLWADAIFLKLPESLDFSKMSIDKLISYLSILYIYEKLDLIEETFQLLPQNLKPKFLNFHNEILRERSSLKRVNFLKKIIKKCFLTNL